MFYNFLIWVVMHIVRKPKIIGIENLDRRRGAVYVSNHLGYYAPIKIMLFSGLDLYPWVIEEVTDNRLCADYLRQDFIEPTLKIKGILARMLSLILAPICVGLMKYVSAIAVYHGNIKIRETFRESIKYLSKGKSVLIFPEEANINDKYNLGNFQSGFLKIGSDYYKDYGDNITFYPVFVNKGKNEITFGEGILFDGEKTFKLERERVIRLLKDKILMLSRSNTLN
ncbi:MAG: hypothetical protein PHQ32_00440 [Firmicutes bacterium]|nr:hypothetical protein [Bacillota bacterium]